MDEAELIAAFVAAFAQLDPRGMSSPLDDPPPPELDAGMDPDDWFCVRWSPAAFATEHSHLAKLRSDLGRRLPRLYEKLVSSYRWLDVDLGEFSLTANPPGDTLDGLWRNVLSVPGHHELLKNGFFPFGHAIVCSERMCFDLNALNECGDCPIVRLKTATYVYPKTGEVPYRITKLATPWPSVEAMMVEIVETGRAKQRPT
jgi:hypothetical protein